MPEATLPPNEAKRLKTLQALDILDTPPERRFDRLTRIAAHLMDTPIALISLVDANRQWFKSHYGLDVCETSRETSFCAHALESRSALTVPDATADVRFSDNPLVTGSPGIRFYMGIPLRGPGDYILGTLCVIDTKPREVSPAEVQALQDLAEVVEDELGRQELHAVSEQLQQSNQRLEAVIHNSPLAIITGNMEQRIEVWNPSAERLFGQSAVEAVGRILGDITPDLSRKLSALSMQTAEGDTVREEHIVIKPVEASEQHLSLSVAPLMEETGKQVGFTAIVADITERECLLKQAEDERQLLDAVMNNLDVGVAACDASGKLTVFNPTARAYIGDLISAEAEKRAKHYQVYDSSGQHLLSPDQLPLYRALQGETVKDEEILVRPKDKPERILLVSGSAYGNRGGEQHGAVVVFHDITGRKELERSLEHQATHDLLTGLPNRGALMTLLSGAIGRAERSGKASAVLFLDLDGFKEINDSHGHQIGDEALKMFSRRLCEVVRDSDTVSRLSGDEFVVIVEQLQDAKADAQRIADKILQANSTPLPLADGLQLKTSIGIALHRGRRSADELLSLADAAMYRAKQKGGSQVFIDDAYL